MEIKEIIRIVENEGPYTVLDVYDFDINYYLVSCRNKITNNVIGDFYFLVDKRNSKLTGYNPAVDPFEYGDKIRKAKILYSV